MLKLLALRVGLNAKNSIVETNELAFFPTLELTYDIETNELAFSLIPDLEH